MIYETLDEIPISKFIDVYLGNYTGMVTDGNHSNVDLKKKATELIYEYSVIVKGKRQMVELYHKDEKLCLQGKICLLESCMKVVALGGCKKIAIDALEMLGYAVAEDKVEMKMRQILGKFQFQLEVQLKEDADGKEKDVEKVDKSYFTKEMAMVMKHNKFTFNPQEVSAAMYAYWLKDMIDYYNMMNRNAK